MIEIPEAVNLAKQLKRCFHKKITKVIAAHSPHKFAWYQDDPRQYPRLLEGRQITGADAVGGMVEIRLEGSHLVFTEGINLLLLESEAQIPAKHQLALIFEDGSLLCASVRMYGGLLCAATGEIMNPYYKLANTKPSPLSKDFNATYWETIVNQPGVEKLSAKAFLATEQRIPGLGNGVLQDILFNANIHPKKKLKDFTSSEKKGLLQALSTTLRKMANEGGRDTETDLFGQPGGYTTLMSKNTLGKPCLQCGLQVKKASYMGGSIYFCEGCQPLG